MHGQMGVLAFALSRLSNPDVGKRCALRSKPVPSELRITPERRDRIGDAALVEMNGGVPVERTVFLRCKNSGRHDIANLAQTERCRAAAFTTSLYFRLGGFRKSPYFTVPARLV